MCKKKHITSQREVKPLQRINNVKLETTNDKQKKLPYPPKHLARYHFQNAQQKTRLGYLFEEAC